MRISVSVGKKPMLQNGICNQSLIVLAPLLRFAESARISNYPLSVFPQDSDGWP